MAERCLLPLDLPDRDLQVVGERPLHPLRLPQLAAVLGRPEGSALPGKPPGERGLPGRLGTDEHHLPNEGRVHPPVHPASVGVHVSPDRRARDRNALAGRVDDDVLGAEQAGVPLVRRLAAEHTVELPEECDAGCVLRGVARVVLLRISGLEIGHPDDVLHRRIEHAKPAETHVERHSRRARTAGIAVVDEDGDVVALREGGVDEQLMAVVKRHELPEDQPAGHVASSGLRASALVGSSDVRVRTRLEARSSPSSRRQRTYPTTFRAW